MTIKLGNTKSVTEEALGIIGEVATHMKEEGARVAVVTETEVHQILIWKITLLLPALVRVIHQFQWISKTDFSVGF